MDDKCATEPCYYSPLAYDPDLADIVAEFVQEMPGRVAGLRTMFKSGDFTGLQRAAHQLKGAAGSYGFDQLTPAAEQLESLLQTHAESQEIFTALDELSQECLRTREGMPDNPMLTARDFRG